MLRNHATSRAARPSDLPAAFKAMPLSTAGLLGRLAKGGYFWPLAPQWIAGNEPGSNDAGPLLEPLDVRFVAATMEPTRHVFAQRPGDRIGLDRVASKAVVRRVNVELDVPSPGEHGHRDSARRAAADSAQPAGHPRIPQELSTSGPVFLLQVIVEAGLPARRQRR